MKTQNGNRTELRPSLRKRISCLSCGVPLAGRKKRYCSVACRQELRIKLTMHTGLLKALNARYASFHFTDLLIIMDLLPYGETSLFSFIYPRSPRKKPGDDFSAMATALGTLWWDEKKKTNKQYLASRQVLNAAEKKGQGDQAVRPVELRIPSLKGKPFLQLNLKKSDLESLEYQKIIKQMFRKEAKKHHPDLGGDPVAFRKIHEAYENLIAWAENPVFINRRGLPDRWFYDGSQNKWVQPIPDYPTAGNDTPAAANTMSCKRQNDNSQTS